MKKILNSKIYNILIIVFELCLSLKIVLNFLLKNSPIGDGLTDFWICFIIEFGILFLIFMIDIILSSSMGILKYVKERNEDKFQIKKYSSISFYYSFIFSLIIWICRTIHYANAFEGVGAMLVLVVILVCISTFLKFWFMLLIFFIGNKIADKKNGYIVDENKECL